MRYNKKTNKFISLLLLTIMIFNILPLSVSAHEAAFLKSLINTDSLSYTSSIVPDNPGWSREDKHIESQLKLTTLDSQSGQHGVNQVGESLLNNLEDPMKGVRWDSLNKGFEKAGTGYTVATKSIAGNKGMIFTFPSKEEKTASGKNDVTEMEIAYATEISSTLTNNLNAVLSVLNYGKKYKDVNALISTSQAIRPKKNETTFGLENMFELNGYYIFYGTDSSKINSNFGDSNVSCSQLFNSVPHVDEKGNLLMYIVKETAFNEDGEMDIKEAQRIGGIIYAMPKGYIDVKAGNKDIKAKFTNGITPYAFTSDKDVAYLTIHHLSFQANFAFSQHGHSVQNNLQEDANIVTEMIAGLMQGIMGGLNSALGLYSTNELLYNQGLRGGSLYNQGVMSNEWWEQVLVYHLIFQLIAFMLIGLAMVKMLVQVNLSTINPTLRLDLMGQIQKIAVVGFLLVLCIPIIRLMMTLNNSFVNIFATQIDVTSTTAPLVPGLAGLLLQFAYFVIYLYINMVYIMRSIMIAILIAMAPFFIVTLAFSTRGKGLFDNWLKEISANIFLQSFHAFAFSFLFNVMASGRGIENVVINFSIIPLTEFFRTMIFGQSGSFAIAQGKAMQQAGYSLGKQTLGAMGSAAGEGLANAVSGHLDGGNTQEGGSSMKGQEQRNSANLTQAISNRAKSMKMDGKGGAGVVSGFGKALSAANALGSVGGSMMDTMQGMNMGDSNALKDGIGGLASSAGSAVTNTGKGVDSFAGAMVKGAGALDRVSGNVNGNNVSSFKTHGSGINYQASPKGKGASIQADMKQLASSNGPLADNLSRLNNMSEQERLGMGIENFQYNQNGTTSFNLNEDYMRNNNIQSFGESSNGRHAIVTMNGGADAINNLIPQASSVGK